MTLYKLPKQYSPGFKLPNEKPVGDSAVDFSVYRLESYLQINTSLTDLVRNKPLSLNLYSNAAISHEGIKAISGSAQFPFIISSSAEKTVVVVGKAFNSTDATIGADGEATKIRISPTTIYVNLDGFSSSFTPLVALDEFDDVCVVVRALADDSWHAYAFKLKTGEFLGTTTRTTGGATSFVDSTGSFVGIEDTGFGRQGFLTACYSIPYDIGIDGAYRLGRNPYSILKPKNAALYFTAASSGITITVTEQGPSFTESISTTLSAAINAAITESGPSFTESINLTLTAKLNASITEIGPSFTESIAATLSVKLNAAITESGPSFTESISATVSGTGISLVDWTSNNTDNDPSMVLNVPTGTVDGDLILFLSQSDGNNGFEVPSGFTALDTENTSASSTMVTAYRVASSEPVSYTITHANSASERAIGYFASYRNVDTSNPIGQRTTNNGGPSTDGVLTALTPTNDNSMVVSFIGLETGNDGNPIISSWPSSLIGIADNVNGPPGTGSSSSSGSFAQELQTTAADVSGNIALSTSNTTWCTTSIVLRPIGATGKVVTITESGPSFTESINTSLTAKLNIAITESGPSFTESIAATLTSLTIQVDITEIGPSFTEGISVTITPSVSISASISEQGPSFTESISALLGVNLNAVITGQGPSFSESTTVSVTKDINLQITEIGPSFTESIFVTLPITITVNPRNIIRVKRKSNSVRIKAKSNTITVKRKSNIIRVR